MNRRQMVILPGMALVAGRAFSQTDSTAAAATTPGTLSHKKLARYSSLKSFYKVPKSPAKQIKYISFLTTLLALTPTQQAQATTILAEAATAHKAAKQGMKTARQVLAENVRNTDATGINVASNSIGRFAGQRHAIGAHAHAALMQVLTPGQQTTLNQLRS